MRRLTLLVLLLGACDGDGADGDIDYIDSEDVCDVAHDAAVADRDRADCVNPDTFLPLEVREADQATWFACYVEWRHAEECGSMPVDHQDDPDCVQGRLDANDDRLAGETATCRGYEGIEAEGVQDVGIWFACYMRDYERFGGACPVP